MAQTSTKHILRTVILFRYNILKNIGTFIYYIREIPPKQTHLSESTEQDYQKRYSQPKCQSQEKTK